MTVFTALKLSDRTAGVLQITMARPEVFNAFDETMISELGEAFAHANSRVRGTAEAREGFDAFLNKRPAGWITKK